MAKPSTYMPIVIGDYLKDTSRLTCEEHGAFLLMLMDYWVNGPLPDDDKALAAICRLPAPRWRTVKGAVRPFFRVEAGRWHNKRADAELQRAAAKSRKAKTSADKRWNGCETDANAYANASPEHMPTQCSSSASPSAIGDDDDARAAKIVSEVVSILKVGEQWGYGLPAHLAAMFREGYTEPDAIDAARAIVSGGHTAQTFKYFLKVMVNRKNDQRSSKPKSGGNAFDKALADGTVADIVGAVRGLEEAA